jgi:hypothetical protein
MNLTAAPSKQRKTSVKSANHAKKKRLEVREYAARVNPKNAVGAEPLRMRPVSTGLPDMPLE